LNFAKLKSQQTVKKILLSIAKTGRLANGYLFIGPEKCGKTTAAVEFARLIDCQSIDFYQLAAENKLKIEQIRNLKKQVQYGPYNSKYLVVNIQRVENLTTEAANSFLKLLEEPPAKVIFILETAQPEMILETIVSRCQKINFCQLNNHDLADILREKNGSLEEEIDNAVNLSGSLLKNAEFYLLEKDFVDRSLKIFEKIKETSFHKIASYVEDITGKKTLGKDKDKLSSFLNIIARYYRQKFEIKKANIVLKYLNILNKKVNLRLTLENMLLKLQEV